MGKVRRKAVQSGQKSAEARTPQRMWRKAEHDESNWIGVFDA